MEFNEKQSFRQWWLWLLLSPVLIIGIVLIVKQLILGEPVGSKPLSNTGVYFFLIFIAGIVFLFLYLRLDTKINNQGISVSYRPFLKRQHDWNTIESIEIYDYGFVGYGFRISKHGWIYNVGGSTGLKIHLKSGKHYTVGTQKAEELKSTLESLNLNNNLYSSATI